MQRNGRTQINDLRAEHRRDAGEQTHCLQSLYRAVILQAVLDAKSRSGKQEMVYWRNQAQHWLFHDRKDFMFVCELAGWHPDDVRRKANKAADRGYFWKNAPLQAVKQKPAKKPRARKIIKTPQLQIPIRLRTCIAPKKPPRMPRIMAISHYVQLQFAL